MRRLTNLALIRVLRLSKTQRISDLNGCDLLNQISFKLIALNRSANSLYSEANSETEVKFNISY